VPDLTPSAVAALCDALAAGHLGCKAPGFDWIEIDLVTGVLTWDPGSAWGNVRALSPDLADVWRSRAPAWAQPALDGLAVSMPVGVTAVVDGDDAQGDLWGPR